MGNCLCTIKSLQQLTIVYVLHHCTCDKTVHCSLTFCLLSVIYLHFLLTLLFVVLCCCFYQRLLGVKILYVVFWLQLATVCLKPQDLNASLIYLDFASVRSDSYPIHHTHEVTQF